MINNTVLELMKCFPRSFVNQHGEFIAHEKANEYFILKDCNDDLEIKCKILEWLSRGACITEPFRSKIKNEEFNSFILNGINKFLGTSFAEKEMTDIYTRLGNKVNRPLTLQFIQSNYDMKLLD